MVSSSLAFQSNLLPVLESREVPSSTRLRAKQPAGDCCPMESWRLFLALLLLHWCRQAASFGVEAITADIFLSDAWKRPLQVGLRGAVFWRRLLDGLVDGRVLYANCCPPWLVRWVVVWLR